MPERHFWFTIGGAVEPGEDLATAALRELVEETGLRVERDLLCGPMWRRVAVFPFNGEVLHSEELFFAVRVPSFEPAADGFTDLERSMRLEHRWFDDDELQALVRSGNPVYPNDLPSSSTRRGRSRRGGSSRRSARSTELLNLPVRPRAPYVEVQFAELDGSSRERAGSPVPVRRVDRCDAVQLF